MFYVVIFTNSIEQMMKDYFLRLKDLREDRLLFQTEKQRASLSGKMDRQEDKYQAYIIEQMNDKNRIIAAVKIVNVLALPIKLQLQPFLGKALRKHFQASVQTSAQRGKASQSRISSIVNNDSMINEVQTLLLKCSLQSIARVIQKISFQKKKEALSALFSHSKITKNIRKIEKIANKFSLKLGFTAIRGYERQKQLKSISKSNNLFEDEFSVIYKQEVSKKQKGNTDESYLSFMFEKENVVSQHHNCQLCKIGNQKDKEIARIKEEVAYLKTLLSQKNIQILKKDELCRKLHKESGEEIDQSSNSFKNSSYYSELQKYMTGGKRIRKNGSRISQNSSRGPKGEISSELLGKYMRESFQLKETIDVARELCLQLRNSVAKNQRSQMCQIVKVLSFGQEVSLVDQY